jgi:hypothetical protein
LTTSFAGCACSLARASHGPARRRTKIEGLATDNARSSVWEPRNDHLEFGIGRKQAIRKPPRKLGGLRKGFGGRRKTGYYWLMVNGI